LPRLASNHDAPKLSFQIARITGMSHWHLACYSHFTARVRKVKQLAHDQRMVSWNLAQISLRSFLPGFKGVPGRSSPAALENNTVNVQQTPLKIFELQITKTFE
jgi:hypothetical protein